MKAAALVIAIALVTTGAALGAESGTTGTEMSAPKSVKPQAHAAIPAPQLDVLDPERPRPRFGANLLRGFRRHRGCAVGAHGRPA